MNQLEGQTTWIVKLMQEKPTALIMSLLVAAVVWLALENRSLHKENLTILQTTTQRELDDKDRQIKQAEATRLNTDETNRLLIRVISEKKERNEKSE